VDAILVSVGMGAQVGAPDRRVNGNVITSKQDPAVRIGLAGAEQYLGAGRFVLLGIADCELHAWVAADAEKKVQRLYWGYLPTKPEMHHMYDSPRRAGIGGLDFYVDTRVRGKNDAIEPRSDREHIRSQDGSVVGLGSAGD
jgi:hypothetical protein